MRHENSLVDAEWVQAHINDPDVIIVDATVHLPDTGRNAQAEYEAAHIPGALFFDLEIIADPDNPRPRKIPPMSLFANEVGKLGVDSSKHVIAYDTRGLYSAARVWWLFRHFGYDNVSVLDGGLVAWKEFGGALEHGADAATAPATFAPNSTRNLLALWPDVLKASQDGEQIVDARTQGRWAGTEIDRYPGARAGHIPGSVNLYWEHLLDSETRKYHSADVIRERFEKSGIDLDRPMTISCGSGLTACILALGLHQIGKNDWRVYDGSWDEWGRNPDLPVEATEDLSA